ncbi:hypothetical protein [Dickeya chrysanthemi]|nr:hypothetical protein [Dickeya chrysanthemi]
MKSEAVATWFLANTETYPRIVVTDTTIAHDFLAADSGRQQSLDTNDQL